MKQVIAKITKNEKIGPGFYRMRIESSYLAKNSKPGQFVEVRCAEDVEPLLRRPLGIHRVIQGGVELLYEVVGKGTELLSRKKADEALDLIGPLGNGFDIPRGSGTAILVAGGNGVAPLLALAEELAYRKAGETHVLIGGKTKSHVLCEKEFTKLGCMVLVSTDDGSKGHKGLVTDMLREIVIAIPPTFNSRREKQSQKSRLLRRRFTPPHNDVTTIYACGPTGMLKAVSEMARSKRIPCQVSLEERMACGVGVCLGCPVKVRPLNGYKMACKDGPVFNAEEIEW